MRADTPPSHGATLAGRAGKAGRQAAITHTHTRTLIARSSEASSICDSSKSLADIDLVPRLAAHSGRSGAFQEQLEGAETTAGDGG